MYKKKNKEPHDQLGPFCMDVLHVPVWVFLGTFLPQCILSWVNSDYKCVCGCDCEMLLCVCVC